MVVRTVAVSPGCGRRVPALGPLGRRVYRARRRSRPVDGAARATRDRSSCARRGNDLRRLRHRVPGHAHHGHMRAAGSACLGANSPDNMVTDAGTEGDRRGRGGAVSTPCRLSPKDAAATLLTALLTVRGRTSKKAVEDWLGTGSAAVREGAAPGDSSSLSRVQDIGRRRRGAKQPVAPHAGRYHYPAVRTVVLPVRRETQQATERLGGVMNQVARPLVHRRRAERLVAFPRDLRVEGGFSRASVLAGSSSSSTVQFLIVSPMLLEEFRAEQ